MGFDYEVGVIGAGPGGLVATLYLRRFLRETILVSAGPPRASWIPKTHNLLGYREGVSGAQLLERLQKQISDLKTDRAVGEFIVRKRRGGGFTLSDGKDEIAVKKVILATGMTDTQPPLESLVLLRRRGLLRYCPVCDAFEYQRKKIIVLAQDAHGLKEARFLSRFSSKIIVLWPPSVPLPGRLAERVREDGVEIRQAELVDAHEVGSEKSRALCVLIRDRERGRELAISCEVCYVALGVTVNDIAFRQIKGIQRSDEGFLRVDQYQRVGVKGLFAVGDCVEGLAQIAVAAGQAAIAATRIHNDLRSEKN